VRELLERYRRKYAPPEQGESARAALQEKKRATEKKLFEIQKSESDVAQDEKKLRAEIEKEKDSSRDAEKELFRLMARQNELCGALNGARMRLAEVEHWENDFKRELTEGALLVGREILEYEKLGTKSEPGAALNHQAQTLDDRAQQEERRRKIERLKIRIEEAGGGSGTEVMKEFEEAGGRDAFLARELADLERAAQTLRHLISELEEKLDAEFEAGIQKINEAFQSFFSLMFGGGSAKLSVIQRVKQPRREVDAALLEEDAALQSIAAEEEKESIGGIEIEVNLPRKKIKGLMMLSGGERALTSIALIFAMSQVKPPPFIILDETDAALDEANSRKYGDMVENLSQHSQLILITHNRETMSRAGVLYGVTMDRSGVSKLLSIAFDEAVAVAK
jgi:chromosome segregation protein